MHKQASSSLSLSVLSSLLFVALLSGCGDGSDVQADDVTGSSSAFPTEISTAKHSDADVALDSTQVNNDDFETMMRMRAETSDAQVPGSSKRASAVPYPVNVSGSSTSSSAPAPVYVGPTQTAYAPTSTASPAPLTATQRAMAQCVPETTEPSPVMPAPPQPIPLLATIPEGHAINSPAVARLYGPGRYVMDGLWNVDAKRAGSYEYFAAIRFRAPVSGQMASVRLYWSDGSGYAGGNGGDITLKVLPDDGSARHLPQWNATPLATGRRLPGSMSMVNGVYTTSSHRFAPDKLTGTGQLEAGKLYHLVAINTAAQPDAHWSSLNSGMTVKAQGRPGRWHSPYDWASLAGNRPIGSTAAPTWLDRTVDAISGAHFSPIMQMTMADGQSFGNTNMETGNADASGRLWKNGSANPVRERFTPKTQRVISGLSIHTAKVSGNGGLGWQILQGSTMLASGTIEQSTANYRVDTSVTSTGIMTWYDIALPSQITMKAGTTYDVVFTPQSSSFWAFTDQRNGSAYGFTAPAAFSESQAQHYLNGSWIDANHWSKTSGSAGSNWRVVLHQPG